MTEFVDGTGITAGSEGCKCDRDGKCCEFPCWQRVGVTSTPCCAECGPLPEAEESA